MRNYLFPLLLIALSLTPSTSGAQSPAATIGRQGFAEVKQCVMQNDPIYCHSIVTPSSYDLYNRFLRYKLMPCLPTDMAYASEYAKSGATIVKMVMPAGGGMNYVLRLVFQTTPKGPKLDVPESLHLGLGDNWENKIELSEQMYLLMRQHLGDKLNCDMLNDLIKK